ncbi:hypothetical protein ACFQVA_17520 [Actinomadura keratinilytica]
MLLCAFPSCSAAAGTPDRGTRARPGVEDAHGGAGDREADGRGSVGGAGVELPLIVATTVVSVGP